MDTKEDILINNDALKIFNLLKSNIKSNDLISGLQDFNRYLKELCSQICPKGLKDSFIYQWIFTHTVIKRRDFESYYKANLLAANKSLDRMIFKIRQDGINAVTNRMFIDFVCDLKPFIAYFDKNQNYSWLLGNTNGHISNFYSDLSITIFWNGMPSNNSEERLALASSTPFVIRQSIEYKIKRILGIDYILINGKLDIRTMERCFKAIEKNKTFYRTKDFDINTIKQIYSWTNYYVHGGYRPEPWRTETAINYLNNLFYAGQSSNKKYLSLYAGVEILEDDLTNVLKNTERSIKSGENRPVEIRWLNKPEVLIIKNK